MIPFGSQRGLGQDLATHLMNEQDNAFMEVAQVRGAVARDLHGAFAEWEAQAHALTKCRNYLYSLSINPDQRQRALTRAEYLDYIDRAEDQLGLAGQPRAVIFHIKHGREHCHVVWSRIDARQEKARHIAFDRDSLMMVTRQFAHEKGLRLPDGYDRYFGDRRYDRPKDRQLSLYEKHQQDTTGLTKEERIAFVTDLWRRADSAKAFVSGLEQAGYILATGKRDYVLVDLYGHMNALPKLIRDREIRTKDLRAFLAKDYPKESLPSVEDAREIAKRHRRAREDFAKAQAKQDRLEALKQRQAERRDRLDKEIAALRDEQRAARKELDLRHAKDRAARRDAYLAESRRLRIARAQRRPKGLAGFLGRVTGVALITKKIQKYRDRKRFEAFRDERERLKRNQVAERAALVRRQELQMADLARRRRALGHIEERERKSLDMAAQKERRARQRGGRRQMPALTLDLAPPGRRAVPHKAKTRHTSKPRIPDQAARTAERPPPQTKPDRAAEFAAAAAGKTRARSEGEAGAGETGGSAAGGGSKVAQARRRKAAILARDFAKASRVPPRRDEETGSGDDGDGRRAEAESEDDRGQERPPPDLYQDFTNVTGPPWRDDDDGRGPPDPDGPEPRLDHDRRHKPGPGHDRGL